MADFNAAAVNNLARAANTVRPDAQRTPKNSLDMTDFLNLMVTELTNQTMDATADTSDMLNQMVQMQMIQAITSMTDASIMTYAASLVGKEVTVGQFNSDGTVKEIVGTVTGTGTMNGEQVVFVGDKYYFMNEIMAVGRLPEREVPPAEDVVKPEDAVKPNEPAKPEGTDKPGEAVKPEEDSAAPEVKPEDKVPTENPNKPVEPGKEEAITEQIKPEVEASAPADALL